METTQKIQTLIGFDFGTKKMGIAIGQSFTKTASALKNLAMQAGNPPWIEIEKLLEKWKPDALIVGIPLTLDGNEQNITHLARLFMKNLKEKFNLPVFEIDERLSTKEAKNLIFEEGGYKALQKIDIDSYVAKLLLEQWMRENHDKISTTLD